MSAAELPSQAELEQLFGLIGDARLNNYMGLVGLVIVIYEYFSHLDEEITLVWQTKMSVLNMFYLAIRYSTLLVTGVSVAYMNTAQTSNSVCHAYLLLGVISASTIIIITTDFVLAARVWILYGRSKVIFYLVFPLVVLELISMLADGWMTIYPQKEYILIGSILPGCYPTVAPKYLSYFTIGPMIVSCFMFTLTVYKSGQAVFTLGTQNTPLMTMFLRDGLAWFFMTMAICVLDFIVWTRARASLAQVVVVPTTAVIAVIGARVLMNIKSALARGTGHSNGNTTATHVSTWKLPTFRRGKRTVSTPWFLRSDAVSTQATDV